MHEYHLCALAAAGDAGLDVLPSGDRQRAARLPGGPSRTGGDQPARYGARAAL